MSTRRRWREVRAGLPDTGARRAGYAQARRSYEIGLRVRQLREAQGLSQEQLAKAAGLTQSAIARLELGGVEPRLSTLTRVGEALGQELQVEFRPHAAAHG